MKGLLLNGVENIVAKGEIACFEKFLSLSQCFQKLSAAEASKRVKDKYANNLFDIVCWLLFLALMLYL